MKNNLIDIYLKMDELKFMDVTKYNQLYDSVIEILKSADKNEAIEMLMECINHQNEFVQFQSLSHYLAIDEKYAIRSLETLSNSSNKYISGNARIMIIQWKTPSTKRYLRNIVDH